MAGSIETRVRRLEDTGGGECPRCSGVVGIFMGGEFSSANKYGEAMKKEAWKEHEAEEEDGCCPVCGEKAAEIVVGWPLSAWGGA